MIRAFLISAALALPAAVPAFAQSAADTQALIAAIAAAGCRVNEGNSAQVLSSAGVSEEVAGAVVDALVASGQAERVGGELVLRTGGC